MIDKENRVLRNIATDELLAELAYRTQDFSQYMLLEGLFNSFTDYDGVRWIVKLKKED